MRNFFIIFWIILIVIFLFKLFGIINFDIFLFIIAPIALPSFIIKYLKIPKIKLDIRLTNMWAGMSLLIFTYGTIYHKLSINNADFLKYLFFSIFGILSIFIFIQGRQYKNKILIENYKPLYQFNKNKNMIEGWITAYYWTSVASLVICLLIFRVK